MNDASARKNLPPGTPRQRSIESVNTLPAHHGGVLVADGGDYFRWVLKTAGIERKQLAHAMRVNDTTVDRWCSGERDNPIERAREICAEIAKKNPTLIGMILLHIAGDGFDGLILDPAKKAAVSELAKAVKE